MAAATITTPATMSPTGLPFLAGSIACEPEWTGMPVETGPERPVEIGPDTPVEMGPENPVESGPDMASDIALETEPGGLASASLLGGMGGSFETTVVTRCTAGLEPG